MATRHVCIRTIRISPRVAALRSEECPGRLSPLLFPGVAVYRIVSASSKAVKEDGAGTSYGIDTKIIDIL